METEEEEGEGKGEKGGRLDLERRNGGRAGTRVGLGVPLPDGGWVTSEKARPDASPPAAPGREDGCCSGLSLTLCVCVFAPDKC